MDKKENFKNFAKNNPVLKTHVENGSMTWQKFYEIYDIYGEDETAWEKYIKTPSEEGSRAAFFNPNTISNLTNLVKKVDMTSVQKHINTAQKAINLFKEFGIKGTNTTNTIGSITKGPLTPRPLNKFFED